MYDKIQWTPQDSELAILDGWNIFHTARSMYNINGKRPYQLQKVDEMPCFSSDREAIFYVSERIADGDETAKKAFLFLAQESPAEYEDIKRTLYDSRF